jgi:hypothetical protein
LTTHNVAFFQQAVADIFHKLQAVLQAHYFIDACMRTLERLDVNFRAPSEYTMPAVWASVQLEVYFSSIDLDLIL